MTVAIPSAKLNVVFKAGALPRVDHNRPEFLLDLGGVKIAVKVSAKAARKLAVHPGGAVLQGRLVAEGGKLTLLDAGFAWTDPPKSESTPAPAFLTPPKAATEALPRPLDRLSTLVTGLEARASLAAPLRQAMETRRS